MSHFSFSSENLAQFERLKSRYPKIDSLSLPCLWMAQYQEGFISKEAMIYIARLLERSPAEVYAIASFYTMFRLAPQARHEIQVCKTLSCKLCGKDELLAHLKERYDLLPGESSKDGKITLSLVECMGACDGAPMICLDETYHEDMSIPKLDKLLGDLT